MINYEEVKAEVSKALLNNNFFTSQKRLFLCLGNLTYNIFPVKKEEEFTGNFCVKVCQWGPKPYFNKSPNILLHMWAIREVATSQGFNVLKHADKKTSEVMLYLNKKEIEV